ncbi:MAG: outer membrane lipoprotein-sorting protein [Elusimicrobia bacterium]|nr:outer membrane lipoprotein-sorting protein [Elusimicrobiota bacterium]
MRAAPVLLLAFASVSLAATTPQVPADLPLSEIVDRANKALRGESSRGRVSMTITTPSWERTLEIEGWNRDRKRALIVVHAPPKEKGDATLRRDNEMWLWMPRAERVVKIPSNMMHSSWQGSDFTYEDIVKADSIVKDYEHRLIRREKETLPAAEAARLGLAEASRVVYLIEGIPKPSAPVVWGKVLFTAAVYGAGEVVPVREEDYSERGELIRTITLSEVSRTQDRLVPLRLECRPARKPGQRTVLLYKKLEFDLELKDSFFSLKELQRKRL